MTRRKVKIHITFETSFYAEPGDKNDVITQIGNWVEDLIDNECSYIPLYEDSGVVECSTFETTKLKVKVSSCRK